MQITEYKEIIKLVDMLDDAGIPFKLTHVFDGWALYYPRDGRKCVCSVIEHEYSYGGPSDLLEIIGLETQAETRAHAVMGFMTAEEVFERIHKHWRDVNDDKRDAAKVPGIKAGV